VFRATGPGKAFIKVDPITGVIRVWLFNFDVDGSRVKEEHSKMLASSVALAIRDSGSAKFLGLASTTANDAHNKKLAEDRIDAVVADLRRQVGGKFKVTRSVAIGEVMAKAFLDANLKGGTKDNTESDIWRGVVINAWNRRGDPIVPPKVDFPIGDSSWTDTASKALDITGGVLGFVDFAVDLAGLTAAATVTGVLGLGVSSLQAIVAMPVIFIVSDDKARYNGKIQGAADALQDCADQYKEAFLDFTVLSKWPAIKVPEIHGQRNPHASQSQNAWRDGQLLGRQEIVSMLLKMEQNPKPSLQPDGKTLRITGRLWLHLISKIHKDNVGVEFVIKPTNEVLKANEKKPWPTL